MNSSRIYLCGIVGFPIAHTASPVMHRAAFRYLDLDGTYQAFEVLPENLKPAIDGIRALGMTGINVTIPHKEKVCRFLDELSPEAQMIGAVNTIKNDRGHLVGYNTDADGFGQALEESWKKPIEGHRFAVVGAGGAARAVIVKLAMSGARGVVCMNRSQERLKSLIRFTQRNFPKQEFTILTQGDERMIRTVLENVDCVINATSLGMDEKDCLPLDLDLLKREVFLYDLVYRPFETSWVKMAKRQGFKAAGGFLMLLYQGAKAFQIWTGMEPPLSTMKRALIQFLRH